MIYPHTDLKFRITITASDFNQRSNPWSLKVIDRFGRVFKEYAKKDFIRDSEGNFYFQMKDVLTGEYKAITTIGIPDDDFASGYHQRTDAQIFLHVNMMMCHPACGCHHRTDGLEVIIERVWSVSIDGEDYLADVDGNPILTSDGEKIYFINPIDEGDENMGKVKLNMTGEEFKKLIEGENPDGQIDTIPEMVRAMHGIKDDETIQEDTQQQIDENMEENAADHSDIDEIFS